MGTTSVRRAAAGAALSSGDAASAARPQRVYVWQLPIRLFHAVVAVCIAVLFPTGWLIAHPVAADGPLGALTMGRMRELHFAAGLLLPVALAWRVYWYFAGNAFARSGFPRPWRRSWWREISRQARDYVVFDFRRVHLGHNALAGLSYVLAMYGLGGFVTLTGLALYGQAEPGGLLDRACGWIVPLLGGSMQARAWHDLAGWGMALFVIAHVYIVLLDARQYRNGLLGSMVHGYKLRKGGEEDEHGH